MAPKPDHWPVDYLRQLLRWDLTPVAVSSNRSPVTLGAHEYQAALLADPSNSVAAGNLGILDARSGDVVLPVF